MLTHKLLDIVMAGIEKDVDMNQLVKVVLPNLMSVVAKYSPEIQGKSQKLGPYLKEGVFKQAFNYAIRAIQMYRSEQFMVDGFNAIVKFPEMCLGYEA